MHPRLKIIVILSVLCVCAVLPVHSAHAANPRDVVINEVAWMGTGSYTGDEWMELYNTTSSSITLTSWTLAAQDGTPSITLSGTIPANGYFLLERTDDTTVNDITADQIYTGALTNTGEQLQLKDSSSALIDTANNDGGGWPAGTNSPKATMERINPLIADTDANWGTNDGVTRNGLDASNNPINGTPKAQNSAYSTSTPGAFTCLDFDGIDDHVEVSDDTSLDLTSTGTLEAWVYMFATSDNAGIIHKGDGSTGEAYSLEFGFGTHNDRLQLVVRSGSGASYDSILSDTALTPKAWYHVAGTWNNTAATDDMKLYINGVLDKTGDCQRSAQNSSQKLIIGARYDFGTNPFSGEIDEVRIWDDVRTQTEIRDYMCKKWTGTDTNLKAYWRFDDGSGTSCVDYSSNTNTGTMTDMDASTAWVCSGAAIGDASAYDYSSPTIVNLVSSDGDDLTVNTITGSPDGVQVYRVDDTPLITSAPFMWKGLGSAFRYWGVFVIGGTSPTYTAVYDYGSYPGIVDENTLELGYRSSNCDFWKDANATLATGTNTLTRTGLHGTQFILGQNVDPRNAIDYNGTTQYVQIQDNLGSTKLDLTGTGTLEAWIYPETFGTGSGIVFKGTSSTNYGFGLAGQAAGGVFTPGSGQNIGLRVGANTPLISTTSLIASKWYHIACTWDSTIGAGDYMKIFINGVQDVTQVGALNAATTSNEDLRFGMQNITPAYFDGRIDEVRIWSDVRTTTEIRSNMCQKLTGNEANLEGYWRFDQERSSTNVPDYDFSTQHNGTMMNFGTAGAILTSRVCSEAPIGDDSAYGYGTSTAISSATLPHADGDYFFATENGGTWNNKFSGIQVYRVDEAPVYPPDIGTSPYAYGSVGLTPPPGWSSIDYYRYWGAFSTYWTTVSQPQYKVEYNYNGNPSAPVDETILGLAKRDSYCDRTWADASATLNTTTNTLTKSNETQNGPPKTYTEYVLGGTTKPLAIALASFTAEPDKNNKCIIISWETATEIDTVGFYLWKSDCKDGVYTLIADSFRQSEATAETQGAKYSYTDCTVDLEDSNSYYYKLEEIDFDNTKNNPFYGPVGPVSETESATQLSSVKNKSNDDSGCFISTIFETGK